MTVEERRPVAVETRRAVEPALAGLIRLTREVLPAGLLGVRSIEGVLIFAAEALPAVHVCNAFFTQDRPGTGNTPSSFEAIFARQRNRAVGGAVLSTGAVAIYEAVSRNIGDCPGERGTKNALGVTT